MSHKRSFFSELRRRNVFRVALTYAVVAWLLIEIASVLLPLVDAPEALITAFVVLLALGFAVALFISRSFLIGAVAISQHSSLASQALHFVFLLTTCSSPRPRGSFQASRFRSHKH